MTKAVIVATGLYAPPDVVSNDELVTAYNAWAEVGTPTTRKPSPLAKPGLSLVLGRVHRAGPRASASGT